MAGMSTWHDSDMTVTWQIQILMWQWHGSDMTVTWQTEISRKWHDRKKCHATVTYFDSLTYNNVQWQGIGIHHHGKEGHKPYTLFWLTFQCFCFYHSVPLTKGQSATPPPSHMHLATTFAVSPHVQLMKVMLWCWQTAHLLSFIASTVPTSFLSAFHRL